MPACHNQWTLFVWFLPLCPSDMGSPTRRHSSSQHSLQGHWNTQATPPRQGSDQRGGSKAFGSRSAISNIIFMINKLDRFWLPNFITLGIYFIFGTKLSWNEGIDACFNVECMLLGRNFDFLGGYLVVTARCLVVTLRYCSLLGGYWWLLFVTGGYCSLPLVTAHSHF